MLRDATYDGAVFYREYAPPPDLRGTVRCFWALRDAGAEGRVERVLPDGCMEIVVHRGAPMVRVGSDGRREIQPRAVLAGQLRTATMLVATGAVDMVGVRFEPAGCAQMLRAPLRELAGAIVALSDVDTGLPPDLIERIGALPDTEQSVACLAAHVSARLRECVGVDAHVSLRHAARVITTHNGAVRIDVLAKNLGWSRRRLERQFERHVGVSPKVFCRVMRLQEVVTRLAQPRGGSLAQLALAMGYADQAHLARDFRELAGQTITEYLAEAHALSDCFTSSL